MTKLFNERRTAMWGAGFGIIAHIITEFVSPHPSTALTFAGEIAGYVGATHEALKYLAARQADATWRSGEAWRHLFATSPEPPSERGDTSQKPNKTGHK